MKNIETQLMEGNKVHKGTHALRKQMPIKWCQDAEDFFHTELQVTTKCVDGKHNTRPADKLQIVKTDTLNANLCSE